MIDSLAVLLTIGYIWLLSLFLGQIVQLFLTVNKKVTLRSGIIIFLALSSLFRVIFWIQVRSLMQCEVF